MSLRDAFHEFITGDEVGQVLEAFQQIKCGLLKLQDGEQVTIEKLHSAAVQSDLPYKTKRLIQLLRERRTRCSEAEYNGKRVAVSGAGPCGLRAAVECRMLGYSVTVVERRASFSRHNIIKTWRETVVDLLGFGLQQFIPNFKAHGHCHLGIRQAQIVLLKAALLFGVDFHYNMRSVGIVKNISYALCVIPSDTEPDSSSSSDHLSLKPSHSNFEDGVDRTSKVDYFEESQSENGALLKEEEVPKGAMLIPFDSLLLAEGESSWMLRNLGFDRKLVRFSQAIGVVVNLKLQGSSQREAFIVARSNADWRASPLGVLDDAGYRLENMEYMQGTDTHFIVATVKKNSLLDTGVLHNDASTAPELLSHENVDLDRLYTFGRQLASSVGLSDDVPFADSHPVQIFDFSSKGRCTTYLRRLPDSDSLVLPIGDALQNPFWPQGLGLNRGFHNALDAVWALHQESFEMAHAERNCAWTAMDWNTFHVSCLNPASQWSTDPITRYRRDIYVSIHTQEAQQKVAQSVIPQRIKDALSIK